VARSSEPAANHRAFIASQAGYYDSQPAKITGMDAGIPLAAFPAVSESVTEEGVGIRSEVPGLKTKDKNPACIARDIRPVFDSPDLPCAEARLNEIVEKYQKPAPKLASWLEGNIIEGLTVFKLPEHSRRRLRTSNMCERVNREIKRRTRAAGLFPNESSVLRLLTAILMETSDEWETGRAYFSDPSQP